MPGEPKSYHAIRIVRVAINSDQRAAYVAQVKAFANASGFTVQFSQTSPYPNDIAAHMEHGDLWVSALSTSFDAPNPTYRFAFYSHRPIPAESLDPFVRNLVQLMGRIPGAVVVEETTPAN